VQPVLDRLAIAALKPGLERGARLLVRARVGADAVSWTGFALGVAAALALTTSAVARSIRGQLVVSNATIAMRRPLRFC